MNTADVWFVLDAFAAAGIPSVVGGGWGVDALAGRQTRDHDDLDVYVDFGDLLTVHQVLTDHGFVPATDWLPTRVQYEDRRDRAVDVHPLRYDGDGSGELILLDGSAFRFPPADLAALGSIGGRRVACLSIERQLLAHSGYEPTDRDRADVALLGEIIDRG